MRALIAKI